MGYHCSHSPCTHPTPNHLAAFIVRLPVNLSNMHGEHVCSQWQAWFEGLEPKMNTGKTSQPGKLIWWLSSLTRGALLLWCGVLALSSLPEEKQEKGAHTVASKCPFPWLGGRGAAASRHVQKELQVNALADGRGSSGRLGVWWGAQEVPTQHFSWHTLLNVPWRTAGGLLRAELYPPHLWNNGNLRTTKQYQTS